MSTQKITDAMIESVDASTLTGTFPAISGAALTNISGGVNTTNANDPAVNTNPSGGVGHVWLNSTSAEMFVCTDATAGENVWTNVGAGSGDVEPWSFQGTVAGYSYGNSVRIEKISFTSDGNATHVADTTNSYGAAGFATNTAGYWQLGPSNQLVKFIFATEADATNIATMATTRAFGAPNSSSTHGYSSGGDYPANKVIDKFNYATEANGTNIGDLTLLRWGPGGSSSETHGYAHGGGGPGAPNMNVIDKFTFASDNDATDVGNLYSGTRYISGISSTTHGYAAGGNYTNTVQKFTFASDANATDFGDLTASRGQASGLSSTTHGYVCGGNPSGSQVNVIDKFAFGSNNNATDVGDLTESKHSQSGLQY